MSNTPEPNPQRTSNPPIWDMVLQDVPRILGRALDEEAVAALCGDMRERDAMGRAKYGMPLTAHNGRNALVDAYQEALDLSAYLRQVVEEGGDGIMMDRYAMAVMLAYGLRYSLMVTGR
jgi:hypothetical protein